MGEPLEMLSLIAWGKVLKHLVGSSLRFKIEWRVKFTTVDEKRSFGDVSVFLQNCKMRKSID